VWGLMSPSDLVYCNKVSNGAELSNLSQNQAIYFLKSVGCLCMYPLLLDREQIKMHIGNYRRQTAEV